MRCTSSALGLEHQHMPAVLKRRHVAVERLPVIGDDDRPALGGELPRDALPLQASGVRMPGHGFLLLGLAQALEQANPAAIGVQGIDVVDDDEFVAMPVELGVHAERRGVALDPAPAAGERRPHRPALGQAAGPDQDQQVEMPLGKSPQIRLQPVVGRKMQHLVRFSGSG